MAYSTDIAGDLKGKEEKGNLVFIGSWSSGEDRFPGCVHLFILYAYRKLCNESPKHLGIRSFTH